MEPLSPCDLIETYRAMLADDPAQPAVAGLLAEALCDAGGYEQAVAVADVALAADAGVLTARLARARALKALCRFEAAAADFAAVVARVPVGSSILVALATSYAELGRLEEAASWLRRAITLDPACTDAYANLGTICAWLDRHEEATEACRQALARDPDHIVAHRNLAVILEAEAPEAARRHRDAAFGRQQIFAAPAPSGVPVVLVLTCVAAASVPLEHLLPKDRYAVVMWFVDYARPDQDSALPAYDLVFNAMGDPDLMPELPASAARLLASGARSVLNHPARVRRTHRGDLPALLAGIEGVVVPPVARVSAGSAGDWRALMAPPVLVRPLGSHGGADLCKAADEAAAIEAIRAHDSAYVTAFVDCRGPDGFYRKYRMIFVDRVAYPYHLAIGPHWMTHYWTAGMESDPARRAEEARFLADPKAAIGARAMAAVATIGRRLDLDYAGVDFSVLEDGRVLVFEANATMLVHPERQDIFAYKNPAVSRILEAFDEMLARRGAKRSNVPCTAMGGFGRAAASQ